MKMFCFTSVRRLGLPVAVAGLTADRAKCNPHFCCSTRQTRAWVQSLRSELTRRRQCIGWNWLQDRRERLIVTTMARESDFNWEDDLMTKWVISLLSLLCGISLSVEQHIYLKQPTNTNKLRSTTNKQTNNQLYHGQELPEAGVPPFKAGKVSRARLRKTETRLGVRETEHCLSGRQWGYCADVDIFFLHIFLLLKSEHCFIVQKEVIKECVHMCQMVAQFGTRWTCVFVFLYLYIWICVFVFAFFVLCIVQTSIKFNLWLNFHLRLADGTEQIQFGDLFRLTESLTNKCVGILQRARKHRLPFTLFTFYLEADLWSTTEKNHPFWQRGDLTLTCELCRLIHFAGDTLWQGEDDQKLVTLIRRNREVQVWLFKTIQEFYQGVQVKSSTLRFFSQNRSRMISIQVYFEHTRQLLPNNPGSNTVFGELSYHWSLSLPRFKSIVVLSFWLFKKQQ